MWTSSRLSPADAIAAIIRPDKLDPRFRKRPFYRARDGLRIMAATPEEA